jgi:hypothetical protein
VPLQQAQLAHPLPDEILVVMQPAGENMLRVSRCPQRAERDDLLDRVHDLRAGRDRSDTVARQRLGL